MEQKNNNTNLLVFLMALVICFLYAPMFINLYNWWENDPNYGHALFIPLASAYLIWQKRKTLGELPKEPATGLALSLFFMSFIIYLLGSRIEMFRLSIISFLIVCFAFTLFFYGKRRAKELVFPVSFMLFMIPIPRLDDLTAPMKLMASKVSTGFLDLVGLAVYREGNVIYLPNFTLEVATACSGLKSLILVVTLAVFYSYIMLGKKWQRITLSLLSIPIAIIANIVRIITVGLVSELSNAKALFHFVHDFSGVFVFIIAGALLAVTSIIVEKKIHA